MAGRPNAPGHSAGEDLLGLHNAQPTYNSGQRPPVDDSQLLERFDIDDSEEPQPRPSTSYDDFVGGRPDPQGHAQSTAQPPLRPVNLPYADGNNRTYSQTSDLNNYSGYEDELNEEYNSTYRYYDAAGPSDDNIPGGGVHVVSRGHGKNRSSMMSMGGIMDRAKGALGMGQHNYSEMDLPLTESGMRHSRADTAGTDEATIPKEKKGFSLDRLKSVFGSKVDPATLGPRMIHLNNAPVNATNKWADNHVSTAKYNVFTFIPKFLFEQFSKYANLFFLFTAVLQQIPNVSPTNRYTTIVPLVIVLLVSATKELVEDYKRKSSDRSLNHSRARVLKGSTFGDTKWVDVAVGDIVRVESEEPFPADLVLLASSEPEGLCYIETANLDGETNLKIKQAIPETAHLVSPADLGRVSGRLRSEQPNSSLYTYEATLTMSQGHAERELPLNPEQLLLRGATLRNTPWTTHSYSIIPSTNIPLIQLSTSKVDVCHLIFYK